MRLVLLFVIQYLLSIQMAMAQDATRDICQFNLHNYELDDQTREDIERGVKTMIEIYKNVFDLDVSENFQINIRIFGDQDEYSEYRGGATSKRAYYSVKNKEVVIWNYCDCCFVRVIFHEASHAILHEHLWHPVWLQEGIAEYLERIEVHDDKAVIGFSSARNQASQELEKEGQLMSLTDFFSISKSQYKAEERKMRLFGWSFIYFLMSSKEGQGMLKNLIWEMNEAAGAEPGLWNRIRFKLLYNDNLEIVKRAIPRDLETLDREWRAWIQQQREKHVFMFSAFNASH